MRVIVTGAAGFIGYHVSQRLLARGDQVIGVDNLNPYYSVQLKRDRLANLQQPGFQFEQIDISVRADWDAVMAKAQADRVVHLAAQAGVRYSLENPHAYAEANLIGFLNVLEGCRRHPVKHLVYASSSSVYGANTRLPFSVQDNVDHPVSLYAASKKANELMAHSYSHLFGIPTTGLRFFTVYGPGRPDMALFLFTEAILANRPITVFNHGNMRRDFTYIDDIVEGVVRVLDAPPSGDPQWSGDHPDPSTSRGPYRVYNIGNDSPEPLPRLIELLERCLGRKAQLNLQPMAPGDVPATWANIDKLTADLGFKPSTTLEVGVERFVRWHREYFRK